MVDLGYLINLNKKVKFYNLAIKKKNESDTFLYYKKVKIKKFLIKILNIKYRLTKKRLKKMLNKDDSFIRRERNATITKNDLYMQVKVHTGKIYKKLKINNTDMLNTKFGEYVYTKKMSSSIHAKKKKKKKK